MLLLSVLALLVAFTPTAGADVTLASGLDSTQTERSSTPPVETKTVESQPVETQRRSTQSVDAQLGSIGSLGCAVNIAELDAKLPSTAARTADTTTGVDPFPFGSETLGSLGNCTEEEDDIYGDSYVTPGDHPAFMQWEWWSFEPAMIERCGAIRVSHQYALTAAHCNATAQMGRAYQGDGDYADANLIPSLDLTKHPKAASGVDLAVIRLAPITAPGSSINYPVIGARESQPLNFVVLDAMFGAGQTTGPSFPMKVMGRGLDGTGSTPTLLKQAFGAVVPDQATLNWPFGCSVAPVLFCSLYSGTSHPCAGDSGGPVFDVDLLVGVLSKGAAVCGVDEAQIAIATDLWEERCWIDAQTQGEVVWRLADGTEQSGLPSGECTPEESDGTACTVEFAEWTVDQNQNASAEAEAAFAAAVAAGENPDPADPAYEAEVLDTSCAEELCQDENDLVALVAEGSTLAEPCAAQLQAEWIGGANGNEVVCISEYIGAVIDDILTGSWDGNLMPSELAECLLGAAYCPDPWAYDELVGGESGLPCVGLHGPINPCSILHTMFNEQCIAMLGMSDPWTEPTPSWGNGGDCVLSGAILASTSNQLGSDGSLIPGGTWNVQLAGNCAATTVICFIPNSYLDYLAGVESSSGIDVATSMALQYVLSNC